MPFDPVLQYIFNESRAWDNLGWAFGGRASIDSNGIRTYNHLVHKRTLNHLAKLTK